MQNNNKNKYNQKSPCFNSGMTLIELMVTISIFVVVTGATVFDYGSFRSSVSIQNLTSDITLTIRKAQSYAIGSHSTLSLYHGFGVHFTTNSTPLTKLWSGSNKSFVLFEDGKNNSKNDLYDGYDSGTICGDGYNECQEILSITSNDQILGITFYEGASSTSLSPADSLDITFIRPNPDAKFCYRINNDSSCAKSATISHVEIEVWNGLSGDSSRNKKISVWNTGQIGIE